jgi:hypothetical protein
MMSEEIDYQTERDAEQLRMLGPAIKHFADNYQKGRPTVILLPGGMGSNLRRAFGAFFPPNRRKEFHYYDLWLTPILPCLAAEMEMHDDIDAGNQVMISDGQISLLGFEPYDRFIDWAGLFKYNVFVYGWDWRRPVDEAVVVFNKFLTALRAGVQERYRHERPDPLEDFTVVGHCFGGLMLKVWLSCGGAFVDLVRNAVTVATPFYGYGGQIHRYFSGEPLLNDLCGGPAKLAQIIASMNGPYGLMFLPLETWLRDQTKLKEYGLDDYPIKDSSTGAYADPYHPLGQGNKVRYPGDPWFNEKSLADARGLLVDKVTRELDNPAVVHKFHNWRAIRKVDDTCSKQSWSLIDRGFTPGIDPDPITDTNGPGDDTIPAWSAWLASTPADNQWTVTGARLYHMFLMDETQVLNKLRDLVGSPPADLIGADLDTVLGPAAPVASREEANNFLAEIVAERRAAGDRPPSEIAAMIMSRFDSLRVRPIVRRIMADILKR